MALIRQCEYEIVPPLDDSILQADTDGLVHPEEAMTAAAITEARRHQPLRRFVFYLSHADAAHRKRLISLLFQGFVNNDGSVVLLQNGHPVGWYRSVASAWRRIRCDNTVWLAWLQPDPADVPADFNLLADRESGHGEPSTWYVSIPFTAFGTQDARMRASDITGHLETFLPGLDRLDVTVGHAEEPDTETHVFCDQPGCLREPGHAGEHHVPRDRPPAESEPE